MVYGSVYATQSSMLEGVEPVFYDEDLSFMEMGALAVEEATNDWNQFMRAIALTELSYVIESGGEELIYEAVDIRTMADNVIKWFKKLWAKIKGIADTAMAKFVSFGKDDQKFLTKYKGKILDGEKNIPSGFSFKGYKFDAEAISKFPSLVESSSKAERDNADKKINAVMVNLQKASQMDSKSFNESLDQYRGALAGTSSVTQSEFQKALKKSFYGSDAKTYINKSDVSANDAIKVIDGAKEAIEKAKEMEKTIKESIDGSIEKVNKEAERYNVEADNTTPGAGSGSRENSNTKAAAMTNLSKYLKSIETVNSIAFSTYITALKDRNRQSKAICVKLVSYTNSAKAKAVGESYSYGDGGSILSARFADVIL